ncbi:AMP-binding protein, partial [Arthrobacter sp. H14]|uniref:AMP-binding protein n=1 Tax=Arthrobacter sp. H14 TaxID=1312959 RepID=UPI00056D2420
MSQSTYQERYDQSLRDPGAFWLDAAAAVDWEVPPQQGVDTTAPPMARWFPDGVLNTCHNALDRHVAAGRGEATALIYDSAMLDTKRSYSYRGLLSEVEQFAGALRNAGVGKGDRVVIYMPMIPEALIAMLATARLGAIHSVVFGGFAATELAVRITDAKPAAVVTASGGLEVNRRVEYLPAVAQALDLSEHDVGTVIVKTRDGFDTSVQNCRSDDSTGRSWLE